MSNVRDGTLVTDQIPGSRFLQMLVQDTIQAPRLILISVDAILDMLRRIPRKVVRLPLHRTHTRIQEEQPVVHLIVLSRALRVRDLVLGIILVDEVLLDAATLEQADLFPVGEGVGEGGDTAVGVDLEEPRLFLLVFGDVDFGHFVRDAELLEGDRDFDPVGGLGRVEVDIGAGSHD